MASVRHELTWHYAAGAPGGDEWMVAGHYVIALAKAADHWIITGMKLETMHQTGNTRLLQEAAGAR